MLLERDREVGQLADLLAGVESEGGKVVLVRGEAGVGKTSLVKEFVARHADEAHVLWGGCDDLSTPQPLAPFYDMARTEASVHAALAQGDRPALFEALLELLARQLRPTVTVVEDTQWAGEATLDAVRYLGRRVAATNGLLVLTYRDEEVDHDHPLRGVIGSLTPGDVARIRLECLTHDAVAEMLEESSVDVTKTMRLTDGNPLFVTEILASGSDDVPGSLRDLVLARAARLAPSAKDLVQTLSVIPQLIPLGTAKRLAGAEDEHLHEAISLGLLVTADEAVSFRHELTRRAIEESLTLTERVDANRTVLEALPADTDPARIAHHAQEAGDVDQLIEAAPRAAAAAAAVGSHLEAIAHYRSLEPYLDQLDPETKGAILDQWGHELRLAGQLKESMRVQQLRVEHHREQGDRRAEAAALVENAFAVFNVDSGGAEALMEQAVDLLGPDAVGADLIPIYEFKSYKAMMLNDFAAAREWADRALDAADLDGDENLIIRCLINLGTAGDGEDYPAGRSTLDEAVRRAEAVGNWREASRALHNHAFAAAEALDLATAIDYAQRGIALATREEVPGRLSYANLTYAKALEIAGEWDEAENLAQDELAFRAPFTRSMALAIVGAMEARAGRAGARDTLLEAWRIASDANAPQRLAPNGAALAEYAWISGDEDIPIDDIKQALPRALDTFPTWRSTGFLALWFWKLGELDQAPEGIAEPYRLIIDGEPLTAAEMWAEIGCPYEEAIALSHGPPESQIQALEKLEDLGATAVATKTRQQLRDQGVRVPRGKAKTTRTHVAGLTARQAEVLDLLAEGLSNPEIADRLFVSPRTVEHHVSAVLSKLDAATRQEAVSRAREQSLLAPA